VPSTGPGQVKTPPPRSRRTTRRALLTGALCASTAALLLYGLVAAGTPAVARLDSAVLTSCTQLTAGRPALVVALKVLSALTVPLGLMTVAALIAVVLFRRRQPVSAIFMLATTMVGVELAPMVKAVVQRPRPAVLDPVAGAGGSSFPSGHALSVTVLVLTGVGLLSQVSSGRPRRAMKALGLALLTSVCAARVILAVHYLTDVLAGVLIGLAWVTGSAAAALTLLRKDKRDAGVSRETLAIATLESVRGEKDPPPTA